MVVGFTTTHTIGAYHHWCCGFDSRSGRGVQHYVINFVSDLRQVGGFLRVIRFPPTNKIDHHDITEILSKVALNTIKPTNQSKLHFYFLYFTQTLLKKKKNVFIKNNKILVFCREKKYLLEKERWMYPVLILIKNNNKKRFTDILFCWSYIYSLDVT